MVLDREIETYNRRLPELLADEGRFVVIIGEEIIGIFDTDRDALMVGFDRAGSTAFLCRQISAIELVVHI